MHQKFINISKHVGNHGRELGRILVGLAGGLRDGWSSQRSVTLLSLMVCVELRSSGDRTTPPEEQSTLLSGGPTCLTLLV